MRTKKLLAVFAAAAAAFAIVAGPAWADDEYDVNVQGGQIVVQAKGGWHVNKNYPWKFTSGGTKLDKTKFVMSETSATLSGVPKGAGKLSGGVCSGDKCKTFTRDVTVQ